LRACYFEDYRYSADLDFSLIEPGIAENASTHVIDCLPRCRDRMGFDVLESVEVNGQPHVAYQLPDGKRRKIKIVAEQPLPGMAVYAATKSALTAADAALVRELRRVKVRVIDARPPHSETGLATRPIVGIAPVLPRGLAAAAVAERIVHGIEAGETAIPSTAF